jgi:hypothetical protein
MNFDHIRGGAMSPTTPRTVELATRESDGIRVSLHWYPDEHTVTAWLEDSHSGERFRIAVAPDGAVDAFFHPFAHAA